MGIGHKKQRQFDLIKTNWKFRYNHGGTLRQKRRGRKARALSTKAPIHLVLKANKVNLRTGLRSHLGQHIIHKIIRQYAKRFFIKVEQISINQDHCHLLIRVPRRAYAQHFFRVIAGQIAQQFGKNGLLKVNDIKKTAGTVTDTLRKDLGLWLYRPFTRVIQGYKAYRIVRDYVQLNKKEAEGVIGYRKNRLKGLSMAEYELLWS